MLDDINAGAKSFGFGLKALKRYPEIIPLITIMGVATVGVSAFSLYALFKKTDVQINRSDFARWETIDVNKPQKVSIYFQSLSSQVCFDSLNGLALRFSLAVAVFCSSTESSSLLRPHIDSLPPPAPLFNSRCDRKLVSLPPESGERGVS
ncbi:uncharacterized protein [Macrobrachium rosenbergii]|uniref:uncharacterized protein n=1 Tax=Macrobrachium rosenbergii TaxID=79674 RepID=UPI0034D50D25